jgi:hypothetical protein
VFHKFGRCPALDKECMKCRKVGHFQSCCRAVQPNPKSKDCHYLATDSDLYDDYGETADEHGLFIDSISTNHSRPNQWQVQVNIRGKPVSFKIDSCAEINCISKELCNKLRLQVF